MTSASPLGSKSVLHIMDGIRAVYHSGPFAWNPAFVWEAKTLLIGTDPVAVAASSSRSWSGSATRCRRCGTATPGTSERAATCSGPALKNPFYREPEHIKTASDLGLGKWELREIDHRKLRVG